MTREEASYILRKFYADGYKSNNYSSLEQALQLAVECLENSPHWTSVDVELPPKQPNREQSKNVLVRTNSGRTKIEYYDYGNDVIKEWWEYNITHWMPLPPPPVVSKMENTGKRIMFKKKAEKQRITMKEVAAILDNPIDWEQRRFEVAKDAYIKIIGTIEKAVAENKTDRDNLDYTSMAYDAIGYANILIEQLMIEVRGGEQ